MTRNLPDFFAAARSARWVRRLAAGVVVLRLLETAAAAASGWERLPSLPEARGFFVCGPIGRDLIVAGGTNWRDGQKCWLDDLWRFDAKSRRWLAAGKLPYPVAYPASGGMGKAIYFLGGSDGSATHRELFRLDAKLRLTKLGTVPQQVVYPGSVLLARKLYVLGGASDQTDLRGYTNSFFSVDLKNARVQSLPDFPAGRVAHSALVAIGKRIYVFAGARYDIAQSDLAGYEDAFVYSVRDRHWKRLRPFPQPVRCLAGVNLDGRHILLAGGYQNDAECFVADAFLYDTKRDIYLRTLPLPYAAITTLVQSGDTVLCVGGEDRKRHRSDQFYAIHCEDLLRASHAP